jgi:segregation and condensation protein A
MRSLISRSPGWQVLQHFLPSNLKQPLDQRSALASHFVASLELARDGLVSLRQSNSFAPLYIRAKDSEQ